LSHLALYRKYRSQSFDDLVGQEHVTRTLRNAVAGSKIAHAYLFVGPRGTGKTSTARILARCLNCENGPTPDPCGECRACLTIQQGSGGDVFEMDAASESGVDDVRDLIESSRYAPLEGRYKVYVIDEVHDLSSKAFDALLKTIEEPPAHVVFILATTEFAKVPATIRSRCQRYEFHRGTVTDLVGRLEYVCQREGIQADPAAIAMIARMADGGYRDALTLLEQAALAADDGVITHESAMRQLGFIDEVAMDALLEAVSTGNAKEVIEAVEETVRRGKEPRSVLEGLLLRLSDLTYVLVRPEDNGGNPEWHAATHSLAARIGEAALFRYRAAIAEAHKEIRDVTLPRLWLELTLLKLAQPQGETAQPQGGTIQPQGGTPRPQGGTPRPQGGTAQPQGGMAQPQGGTAQPQGGMALNSPETSRGPREAAADVPPDVADAWCRTVTELSQKWRGTGKMLEATSAHRVDGNTLFIRFVHASQFSRLNANPAGQTKIADAFRSIIGPDWNLRFEPEEKGNGEAGPIAEGDALAEMVESVLDAQPAE
jgi:DNA polymerase-3 subunit gamma/tau